MHSRSLLIALGLSLAAVLSGCTPDPDPAPTLASDDGCPPTLAAAVAEAEGLDPADPAAVLTEWGLATRYVPACAFERDGTVQAFYPHEDSAVLVALEQDLLASGYTVTTGSEQHPELSTLSEVVASSEEWELTLESERYDDRSRPYDDVFVNAERPFDYVLVVAEAP
ncbi:hypothetical protein DVJ78_00715 [Humibacter sp. BT305]|nr:hypothetical protein DVJ78_00715 [Humibacter sp. BT305]